VFLPQRGTPVCKYEFSAYVLLSQFCRWYHMYSMLQRTHLLVVPSSLTDPAVVAMHGKYGIYMHKFIVGSSHSCVITMFL
jgi:hypothetical protein